MNSTPEQYESVPYRLAYTFTEARELLGGITVCTLRKLLSEGLQTVGPHQLISLAEMERFLEETSSPYTGARGPYKRTKASQEDEEQKTAG